MKYLQQPVCGWFERRRVSTTSLKEGVRYKSCLQTARVHSRLQRHLFVWRLVFFMPPFSFTWTWKRMKVAGCVHSFRLIMRVGLTGMVIWQPLHFLQQFKKKIIQGLLKDKHFLFNYWWFIFWTTVQLILFVLKTQAAFCKLFWAIINEDQKCYRDTIFNFS